MLNHGIRADGRIVLQILIDDKTPGENAKLSLESPGVEGYIIGRSDAASNYMPDIDLAPYDAQQKGISRRHAVLVRYRDHVHVIDLGSMNGTYVNGMRLSPQVAYALNSGDQVSFANLNLIISQTS